MALESVARQWWAFAMRGTVAILLGILILMQPGISAAALILMFGAFAIADGIFAIVASFTVRRGEDHWWVLLLSGLISLAAGILTFIWPSITALAIVYCIAAWALLMGVLEIAAAIKLRKVITNEWALILLGVISIFLGVLIISNPLGGVLAIMWWIAAYAIIAGFMLLIVGFRLRGFAKRHLSVQT